MILVTGGVKSGKSSFALRLAMNYGRRAFIATGVPFDEDMRVRIERHKRERGGAFDTYEEPVAVDAVLRKLDMTYDVVLFECLTTWLGNLFHYGVNHEKLIDSLIDVASNFRAELIVVTNEVGWGIVPDNELARRYVEVLGKTNARLAELSKEVYLVVSGIGVRIK